MRRTLAVTVGTVTVGCALWLGIGCGGPPSCSLLTGAECSEEPVCRVLVGRTVVISEEAACFEAAVDAACGADMDCPAVETSAAPPDDPSQCMLFGGCIPEGWVPCDPDPGDVIEEC